MPVTLLWRNGHTLFNSYMLKIVLWEMSNRSWTL